MHSIFQRAQAPATASGTRFNGLRVSRLKLLLAVTAAGLAVLVASWILRPAAVVDLSLNDNALKADLYAHWQKGDLVVLLRHAERCDHSTNPCLGPADGITRKGQAAAVRIGQSLSALGLEHADIFNSPLTRTAQTSRYAFANASTPEDWLANCRQTMLRDVLAHKVDQRNLILVSHSECADELENSLNVTRRSVLGYASALFVTVDPHGSASILGFLDVEDWKNVLAQRPPPAPLL
jgi:phosphohistidine phosphatase SixA